MKKYKIIMENGAEIIVLADLVKESDRGIYFYRSEILTAFAPLQAAVVFIS